MGMPGHAFFLKTDRTVFAHVHSTGTIPMASLPLVGASRRRGSTPGWSPDL
jgi:hypothetical protein